MKLCNILKQTLLYSLLICFFSQTYILQAEEVELGYDERGRSPGLRRMIPVAINVYAKEGTVPQVKMEEGTYAGIDYNVLRIDPSEDTFLQVDYSNTPVHLNMLYDYDLVNRGYVRIGGVNANYFANGGDMYGFPAGTVRINNEFCYWQDTELSPSYGNGYATIYFNNTKAVSKYHGWAGDTWIPNDDGIWRGEQTGVHAYGIDSKFAFSGTYTYFANGEQVDITAGHTGGMDYHGLGRAFTVFAQCENKQYLLITFFGTISDANVINFLSEENAVDAIRLDGGGSTQMVYEDTLVNLPYVASDYSSLVDDTPLFGWENVEKGYPKIEADNRPSVSVKLRNEDQIVFSETRKEGDTLSILAPNGDFILDHMPLEEDIDLNMIPTSSSNLIAKSDTSTFYYDSQKIGTITHFLKTGTSKDLVLLAFFDEEIPPKDKYSFVLEYQKKTLFYKTDTHYTKLCIYDENQQLQQEQVIDMDQTVTLVPQEVPGKTFLRWSIEEKENTVNVIPIYREYTLFERILETFSLRK